MEMSGLTSSGNLTISRHFEKSETVLTMDGLADSKAKDLVLEDEEPADRSAMTRSETAAWEASHTPISLCWDNLSWQIAEGKCGKAKERKLKILKNLSGAVKPGEMLAIIGGSGAGKSTLLDILAMRKTSGETDGDVLFNGVPGREIQNLLRRVTGYVTQEDIMQATLTVRETLMFTAELRLDPNAYTKRQREARVEKVMKDLGIDHRADMRIGNEEKRGLSGGEKKRVAIGVQLVTDPSVLYLDEPTSGLDAYNSLSVMRLLRKLAEKGKTIVTTIHQPRSTIFELFDRLLVLNKGETVYMGKAADVTSYYAKLGFEIPPAINPADYIIDVVLDPNRADFTTVDISKLDFAQSFKDSDEGRVARESVEHSKTAYTDLREMASAAKPFATNFLKQFSELARRHLKELLRNPTASLVSLIQAVMMAFIIGSIFYQLGYIAPAAIQGRVVLFFVIINSSFSLSQATAAFIEERLLANRERASGFYSAGPYYWSRTLVDLPLQILQTILFSTIMYWMAELNSAADRYCLYLAIIISTGIAAGGLYNLIGALSPNITVGNILVPVVTVLFFLFAGFFINAEQIPDWWIWVYWWSFFRYSFPAAMLVEFTGTTFTCAPGIPDCITSGEAVLLQYSVPLDYDWAWQCVLVLLGMGLGYRILTYLVIRFLTKERR